MYENPTEPNPEAAHDKSEVLGSRGRSLGQFMIFNKIYKDFEAATGMVDMSSKRRYRKSEAELMALRHSIGTLVF